jgi:hypothetical protein
MAHNATARISGQDALQAPFRRRPRTDKVIEPGFFDHRGWCLIKVQLIVPKSVDVLDFCPTA